MLNFCFLSFLVLLNVQDEDLEEDHLDIEADPPKQINVHY